MPEGSGYTRVLCGEVHVRRDGSSDDEAAAGLAARQEGIARRRQLLDLAISSDAIDYRISVGRFHRLFRGVYAIGHAGISPTGRALAAVMACLPDAVASHETALFLAGLIPPSAGPPHVTTVEPRRAQSGLIAYRAKLPSEDVSWTQGVPVTTLARTFLDVAPRHEPAWVRRLIKDAEFRRLLTVSDLVAVLRRHPNWRGRRALAAIVAPLIDDSRPTRSELEDRFLAFCRRRKLPLPETNARLVINGRRYEPDALWRATRVIVELDGRDAHARELAFHEDRTRDRAFIAAGWAPIRITSGQLHHDGDAVAADLRLAFSQREPRGLFRPGAG